MARTDRWTWLASRTPIRLATLLPRKAKPSRPKRAPTPARPWSVFLPDGRTYHARAHTKSEARAHAKQALGLPRLPVGTVVRYPMAPARAA